MLRKVMANKDKNPGLIGVVADIIKVDKEYEIAIKTALGLSLIHIFRQCRKKHICTDFHTIIMRIIRSDVTASMEQATVSYLRKRRK